MTSKTAILLLRKIKIYCKGMSQREVQIIKEALVMAIKALELFDRSSGHWIHKNDDHFDWLECSSCGYGDEGENNVEWNYCPVCGAKMKEETT